MTTLISRKRSRQRMTTLLQTDVATLAALDTPANYVFDHEIKNIRTMGPIVTVHSDGTGLTFPDYVRMWHHLIITILYRRGDDDATEDRIDDLSNEIMQALYDNTEIAGYWSDLEFLEQGLEQRSEMGNFLVDDTIQYRFERIFVAVKVIE